MRRAHNVRSPVDLTPSRGYGDLSGAPKLGGERQSPEDPPDKAPLERVRVGAAQQTLKPDRLETRTKSTGSPDVGRILLLFLPGRSVGGWGGDPARTLRGRGRRQRRPRREDVEEKSGGGDGGGRGARTSGGLKSWGFGDFGDISIMSD